MQIEIKMLRKISCLALLGCKVEVKDGRAYAPVSGLIKAGINFVSFKLKVLALRQYWTSERRFDRKYSSPDVFLETYMCTRYQCRVTLGPKWMDQFWGWL